MKKIIALLTAALLLITAAAAESAIPGLEEAREKLAQGMTLDRVFYTEGYGFSSARFESVNREEIDALWAALNRIRVKECVDEYITDWYPQIIFYLSDGSTAGAGFESRWLSMDGKNYALENDEEFWDLAASLMETHDPAETAVSADDGWEAAEDSSITDEIRALFEKAAEGLVGVSYEPVAYLGCQTGDGTIHALLCRATTVYPGAAPRWTIMYLSEGPDGEAAVAHISDLIWEYPQGF